LLTDAPAIGAGIGLVIPLAFAALAAASPPEPMGQTMARPRSAASSATPVDRFSSARWPHLSP